MKLRFDKLLFNTLISSGRYLDRQNAKCISPSNELCLAVATHNDVNPCDLV